MRRSTALLVVFAGVLMIAAALLVASARPAKIAAAAVAVEPDPNSPPMVLRAPVPRQLPGRAIPPWQLAAARPPLRYLPGTYVPRGFDPNFRDRIVAEFQYDIDRKLGRDFPAERRAEIARVQNEFWDQHGPNVDLLQDGKISQPEFAERTHMALIKESESFAGILSDAEFEKLFDFPKGVDFYSIMAHSSQEQAGMPFQPEKSSPPIASNMAPKAAPPLAPAAPVPGDLPPAPPHHDR